MLYLDGINFTCGLSAFDFMSIQFMVFIFILFFCIQFTFCLLMKKMKVTRIYNGSYIQYKV